MRALGVAHQQARVVVALCHQVVVDSLEFRRDVVLCHLNGSCSGGDLCGERR